MIDRYGHAILIAWPAHHIVWIEAAMTLPSAQRLEAFADIAAMTGRGYASVYNKARGIAAQRVAAQRRELQRQRLRAQSQAWRQSASAHG